MSRSLKTRIPSKEWGFQSDFASTKDDTPVVLEKESWLEKYQPKFRSDLAVHKKKIERVFQVLSESLSSRRHKIVILSGPPGTGKSATVRAIARDMQCDVEEWVNPIITYEQGVMYENEVSKFRNFMLSSSRYNSLFGETEQKALHRKKIVLVEELPSFAGRQSQEFWDIVKTYHRTGLHPVVMVISDSVNTVRVPPEYINIQFNPVADTFMTRALKLICSKEKIGIENIPEIVACSGGDLRNAILSLQFSGVSKTANSGISRGTTKRRKVETKVKASERQSVTRKDSTLFFFHALGKFMYAKRVENSPLDCDDEKLGRRKLEFDVEDVADKCTVSGGTLTEFIHHNYLGFQHNIDNTLLASECLCDSDIISSYWTEEKDSVSKLEMYSKSLTTRGTVFSKDTSFVPKFTPFCRPVQRDIAKNSQENSEKCRELFALQHMGTNQCFLLDTLPFLKKIGYRAKTAEEYSLMMTMSTFKTSAKCGVSLNTNEGVNEENDSQDWSCDLKSRAKEREDIDLEQARELEEEIAEFSD